VTPSTVEDLPLILDVKAVAALAAVSRNAVYTAIRAGELRAVRLGAHSTRIPRAAVVEWLGLGTKENRQEDLGPGGSEEAAHGRPTPSSG
jgi:excisionase family DNA binding protein